MSHLPCSLVVLHIYLIDRELSFSAYRVPLMGNAHIRSVCKIHYQQPGLNSDSGMLGNPLWIFGAVYSHPLAVYSVSQTFVSRGYVKSAW